MRDAKIGDIWRGLSKRVSPDGPTSLKFSGLRGFSDVDIEFSRGLTVLAGANGVGKSTIIDAIYCSIVGELPLLRSVSAARFNSGKISLSCKSGGAQIEFEFPRPSCGVSQTMALSKCEPGVFARKLRDNLYTTENFQDLLNGVTPQVLSGKDLEIINYIVGKEYTALSIYEIEAFSSEEVPYFKCSSVEGEYGAEDMGLGELSLLCLYWLIERQDDGAILLIEEPETHLAFRSQRRMFNYLASRALLKKMWVIVSTHSGAILEAIPLNHLRIINRAGGNVSVVSSPTEASLYSALELRPRIRGAVLLEDKASCAFLKAILRRHALPSMRSLEFLPLAGESDITKAMEHFPRGVVAFKLAGIYDGDFKIPSVLSGLCVASLPGGTAPDAWARSIIMGSMELVAKKINIDTGVLHEAVSGCNGSDHHQWIGELSATLSISVENLFDVCYQILDETHADVVAGLALSAFIVSGLLG